ncbi:hypothetical protein E2562_005248 [Oryza meyeriana var. granulata]|uniref:Uncharacterized protein n=1 Tax=Oryza meyeriana var. granulata TaxID=110450 RepID=A0A6G1EFC0_9ORYZ|nr:hypothetical protein E2562_005248 [Oryza meyeriana var. granulata]
MQPLDSLALAFARTNAAWNVVTPSRPKDPVGSAHSSAPNLSPLWQNIGKPFYHVDPRSPTRLHSGNLRTTQGFGSVCAQARSAAVV